MGIRTDERLGQRRALNPLRVQELLSIRSHLHFCCSHRGPTVDHVLVNVATFQEPTSFSEQHSGMKLRLALNRPDCLIASQFRFLALPRNMLRRAFGVVIRVFFLLPDTHQPLLARRISFVLAQQSRYVSQPREKWRSRLRDNPFQLWRLPC